MTFRGIFLSSFLISFFIKRVHVLRDLEILIVCRPLFFSISSRQISHGTVTSKLFNAAPCSSFTWSACHEHVFFCALCKGVSALPQSIRVVFLTWNRWVSLRNLILRGEECIRPQQRDHSKKQHLEDAWPCFLLALYWSHEKCLLVCFMNGNIHHCRSNGNSINSRNKGARPHEKFIWLWIMGDNTKDKTSFLQAV